MINQETPAPKRKYFRIGLATAIAVIVIISSYAVYALAVSPTDTSTTSTTCTQSTNNNSNVNGQSSISKGAYATYQGQASIMSISVIFNAKMEVTDINQTHAQVATSINMSTPYGATQNTTTMWINLSNMTFQPDGLTLNSNYTTQVSITSLGTRICTVYEYKNEDITVAYYIDNTYHWPIKMTMTSPVVNGQSYSMDVNLVDTNIPGL